jgi:hypothetical protein
MLVGVWLLKIITSIVSQLTLRLARAALYETFLSQLAGIFMLTSGIGGGGGGGGGGLKLSLLFRLSTLRLRFAS